MKKIVCRSTENTTLVLSYRWLPINIITAKDAFRKILSSAAHNCPIYSIGPSGEMYRWSEWINPDICTYHSNQPYLRSLSDSFPVPTILLTTSMWEYKTPIKHSLKYLYARFKGHCQICGASKSIKDMTMEHIIPKSKYGLDDMSNITMTCYRCNNTKGSVTPYTSHTGSPLSAPSAIPFFHTFQHYRDEWENYLFKVAIS